MIEGLRAEELLAQKGIYASTIVGVSMHPLLKARTDTVVIEKLSAPPRKYDVVLFRRGTQLVLHRIVDIRNGQCRIQGDNCIDFDLVPKNRILGIMTSFTHKGKQFSTKSKFYRIYSTLWVWLFPLRRICQRFISFGKRIFK